MIAVIKQPHPSERRKHQRLESNIPVKICCDEFDIVTQTANVSRSGVYCRVNKYIEPMTKLKIQLLLPFKGEKKTVTKKVSCYGVIVRTESVPKEDAFNVAIYFNDMASRDAACLADFINSMLDQNKIA